MAAKEYSRRFKAFGWLVTGLLVVLGSACGESVTIVDIGGDVRSDAGDAVTVELPQPATADTAAWQCPGGHGCACTTDADCGQSGLCVADGSGKSACALPCPQGYCAPGFVCRSVTSGGVKSPGPWCVAQPGRLCDPCKSASDCRIPGHEGAACVDYGAAGKFCGASCTGDADCGAGYRCGTVPSVGAGLVQQCVKIGDSPTALGVCGCSPRAVAAKLETTCGSGSCVGTRSCGDEGLTACSAKATSAEVCNGQDDDCDGQTDEGMATVCDDKNACTTDTCDPAKGCQYAPVTGPCEDGSVCTSGDACKDGACVAGPAQNCDDGNACSDDSCDKAAGCIHLWPAGKACDDGNPCSESDGCVAGKCAPSKAKSCDDANPCTTDGCDPATGCTVTKVSGGVCSDGDACTGADTCADGVCAGATVGCDDGNPCTTDSCDSAKGCQHSNVDGPCDDGNLCTSGEKCSAGKCAGGIEKVCTQDNPCVIAACKTATGQCGTKLRADGTTCADGKACTSSDACSKGACVGQLNCDDKDACTADFCGVTGACAHSTVLTGTCQPASCKGVDCDDKNPCTVDGCDASGCTHVAQTGASCDDGSACTAGDACTAVGGCVGAKVVCNDDNPCTDDSCDVKIGCTFLQGGGPCDAGGCKAGQCAAGACVATGKVGCDDGNPCTTDACVDNACTFVPVADGVACDDGAQCTTGDVCSSGACGGKLVTCPDGGACSTQTCDENSGNCVAKPATNGTPCSDGDVCTGSDVCLTGVCKGAAVDCDDKNPCTADSCVAPTGCVHTPTAGACDDGNACTSGDSCAAGTCAPGAAVDCDDKNPCNIDACDPSKGCVTQAGNDSTACDDGDACTTGDQCAGGVCKGIAQPDAVSTLAGAGVSGVTNAKGTLAKFTLPQAIAVDAGGTLYVADGAEGGNYIRKIAADGTVTTLAGKGLSGFADGTGSAAQFWSPSGLVVDGSGNVYVADRFNQRIRMITPAGVVTTLAGTAADPGFFDTKAPGGFLDGAGDVAQFDEPTGIALGPDGKLYIAEAANHRIRSVAMDGTVATVAGTGVAGMANGAAAQAQFNTPTGIAVAANGDIFVADSANHRIRLIKSGTVTTWAGVGETGLGDAPLLSATFTQPTTIALAPDGTMVVTDTGNNVLRALSLTDVTTVAGTGLAGYLDGLPGVAQLNAPQGVVRSSAGVWFVSDTGNFRIRKLFLAKQACAQ